MMNPQQMMAQKGMMQQKGGPAGPNPQMMGMMGKGGPGMMPMAGMMGKGGPGMPNPQQQAMMMAQKGQQMGMMGQKGMMPGGPVPGQMPQQGQQPQGQQAAPQGPGAPLQASALAAAPPSVQKQMIGEKLYPAIARLQPELSGKITGMMLEMDNSELLILLESEAQLKGKVDEAMTVLQGQK